MNVQSSAIIATLLKENPKPVFLLGAGASVTSGIPLAGEIVSLAARWAYARQSGKDNNDPRITRSDWYPWLLATHSWFKEDVPQATLFPYAVEHLLQPQKVRKDFWIQILNPDVPISIGYLRLVELMHLKKITNVLTTNFDECIAKARTQTNRPHHIDIIKTPSDYTKISSTPPYPAAIYLHGAVENYTDKNVIEEIDKMDETFIQHLQPLLKDYPLVVIGYRGYEASVMQHLLINNAEKLFNFKNGIYWCIRKGDKPEDATEYVKTLAASIGSNFQFVEIESFDHLFDKVIWSHLEEQKSKITPVQPVMAIDERQIDFQNFDLKNNKVYDPEDFDRPLLRIRVTNYCSKLNVAMPDKVDDSWLLDQMLYLNLIRNGKGHTYATNAGLLLFGKSPQLNIPSAVVKIRFVGANAWLQKVLDDKTITGETYEKDIEGNLWNQLNEITNALALINKPFRLKGEKSENVLPYDPLALKEVVVNSFVHRDYEIAEPNIIEIYPDSLVIKNPGGLTEEVKPFFEDEVMYEEIKKGRRGIKGYRNPVLADLFYSSGDMDKKGSGLYDVVTRVEQNSGFVEFSPAQDNTYFSVQMWCRPEAIDEITNTASPLSIITTKFSTNIIEFKTLPDYVYYAPSLYGTAKEMFSIYDNISFPPFHLHEKKVFSFSDPRKTNNTLRNIIDLKNIQHYAIDEFLDLEEGDRRFIRMINDYLKSYLYKLGLIVDQDKKRAYFPKTEDGERVVTYQARFKRATRTIVRPRYNAAKDKIRYWEHKAFTYSVKRFGDQWGLLIEPTYVFTRDGGKLLLASERIGPLATKKASRDYNINVLNDITFWMWVMSKGTQDVFRLSVSAHEDWEDDIILSSDYLSASLNYVENVDEVREENLIVDDSDIDEEIAKIAEEEAIVESDEETEMEDDQI
jgi:predicted HTH transcriptional regulator